MFLFRLWYKFSKNFCQVDTNIKKSYVAWMKSNSMYVYFYNGHLYYGVAESFALHWPLFSFVEQITCLSHGDNLLIPTSPLPLSTLDKWGTYFKYLLCHVMGIAIYFKGLFINTVLYHANIHTLFLPTTYKRFYNGNGIWHFIHKQVNCFCFRKNILFILLP